MKKLLVLCLIMALALAGCATVKDWVCTNRVTIENYVNTAQSTVDAIDTAFPNLIPAEYQVVKVAAYTVIAIGKNILDTKVCPTTEDVTSVQMKQSDMQVSMKKAAKISATRALGRPVK